MRFIPAQCKTWERNGVFICALIKDVDSNFGNRVL
jgi:hypothetical protein